MLTNPTTVYPVQITLNALVPYDPNSVGTTINKLYFEDRMVYSNGAYTSLSSPYLIVGDESYIQWETYTYYDEYCCEWIERTEEFYYQRYAMGYMKYDISSFSTIDSTDIYNATLILHDGSGNSSQILVDFYRVTDDRTENTVNEYCTYDNYYTGNVSQYFSKNYVASENRVDLTKLITD